jgi:hypothetical protein
VKIFSTGQVEGLCADIKWNASREIKERMHQLRDMCLGRGCTNAIKIWNHLKFIATSSVKWSNFRTEDPTILGVTVQNVVATATRRQSCVHHWLRYYYFLRGGGNVSGINTIKKWWWFQLIIKVAWWLLLRGEITGEEMQ